MNIGSIGGGGGGFPGSGSPGVDSDGGRSQPGSPSQDPETARLTEAQRIAQEKAAEEARIKAEIAEQERLRQEGVDKKVADELVTKGTNYSAAERKYNRTQTSKDFETKLQAAEETKTNRESDLDDRRTELEELKARRDVLQEKPIKSEWEDNHLKGLNKQVKDAESAVTSAERSIDDADKDIARIQKEKTTFQDKDPYNVGQRQQQYENAKEADNKDSQGRMQATYGQTYEEVQGTDEGRARENERYDPNAIARQKSEDDCSMSATIDAQYGCSSTKGWIEKQEIADTAISTVGSLAVSGVGQAGQKRAFEKGTQSAALEAEAKTAKVAGYTQGGLGLLNTTLGLKMWSDSNDHKKNAKDFRAQTQGNTLNVTQGTIGRSGQSGDGRTRTSNGYIEGNTDISRKVVNRFEVNKAYTINQRVAKGQGEQTVRQQAVRDSQYDSKAEAMQSRVSEIGASAAGEQTAVSKQADKAGWMALIKGSIGLVNSITSLMVAKEAEKAAKKLRAAETAVDPNAIPGQDPFPNPIADAPRSGSTFPSDGTTTEASILAEDTGDGSDALPPGLDPGLPGEEPVDRVNIAQIPNDKAVSQGQGGASGIGAGNTPTEAQDPSGGEAKASPYSDDLNGRTYLNSGYAAGGGGPRGGDDGPGIDLGGMLAQFLPKDEKDAPAFKTLEEYGNRGPANAGVTASLLSRDENLFERISMAYQEKSRRNQFRVR